MKSRKKLIEVSIPLEAINVASAREKSIRHGHPSTLHLWWARRPLAACRAILFAQLVDDPSSWPERFDYDEAKIDVERRRLHKVIEAMVTWEASNDEAILNATRWEIARSVAWALGEEPPTKDDGPAILQYLQTKAPPVYDPFSGGGAIPLEAQRLGLRAYGADLNPVAVLIGKALVEIPPKFAGRAPINPTSQSELDNGGHWNDKAARGLAEDVRYYGQWVRDEAEKRIGHLYPLAKLPDGSTATVIAWIWARTVMCPNPACRADMPLSGSFMLSTKGGQKTWAVATFEKAEGRPQPLFTVQSGPLTKEREKELSIGSGYMAASGKKAKAVFRCVCCGEGPVKGEYVDAEANGGRMSCVPVAIVAEGQRGRTYLSVDAAQRKISDLAATKLEQEIDSSKIPTEECRGTFASNAQGRRYGFKVFADYFTARQLVALTTFSDLVGEVRDRIVVDGLEASFGADDTPLHAGGSGAAAYADAIITYLGFAVDRLADRSSTLCTWDTGAEGKSSTGSPGRSAAIRGTFSRQAISMTWDFAEANVFSSSAANFNDAIGWVLKPFDHNRIPAAGLGSIVSLDAAQNHYPVRPVIISTDPPYYDNIGYADLSDFFYVWLRRCLHRTWPDLFRRLTTPKTEELIATPYRRREPSGLSLADSDALSDKDRAEAFFMGGMRQALAAMRIAARDEEPLAIYYAFKQSEVAEGGVTSAGWAAFLQAVVNAGLSVDGTWPIRTELASRMIGIGANALASSIVLVCRKRSSEAPVITRTEFIRTLKRELPGAIDDIRKAGVGPVDMQQSVIGPGMGVFSRHERVIEDDDSAMGVRTALTLINRVWEEIENELDTAFDAETQVALAWFATYGFEARPSGELITLTTAKNTSDRALFACGLFKDMKGKTALTPRAELPTDWSPETDRMLTVWECVQHTARVLNAPDGGGELAARLIAQMGPKAEGAPKLAGRLFEIATKKGWTAEALVYNELAQEWANLEEIAEKAADTRRATSAGQAAFTFERSA